MKKLVFIAGLALLAGSCKKDDGGATNQRTGTKPDALLLARTQNEECNRIVQACTDWNEMVGINDNVNYGLQSAPDPKVDYWLTGYTSDHNLKIWVDGTLFTADDNGQWFDRANGLDSYYGKTVRVKISNEQDSLIESVYVPAPLRATGLYNQDSTYNLIYRTGNTLTWTPDPNNPTGKVAIEYKNTQEGSQSSTDINRDILIVEDNGSFNLDPYIAASADGFEVNLYRGNVVAFQNGAKKVLFSIRSTDMHTYLIR